MLCLGTRKANSYGQYFYRTGRFWLGETALIFHIVCSFAMRSGHATPFVPRLMWTKQSEVEDSVCEHVEPRGRKRLGGMKSGGQMRQGCCVECVSSSSLECGVRNCCAQKFCVLWDELMSWGLSRAGQGRA